MRGNTFGCSAPRVSPWRQTSVDKPQSVARPIPTSSELRQAVLRYFRAQRDFRPRDQIAQEQAEPRRHVEEREAYRTRRIDVTMIGSAGVRSNVVVSRSSTALIASTTSIPLVTLPNTQ